MNDYSEDSKGLWFPKNLWIDKNTNLIEKGILVVIENLDKSNEHYWATNNNLADFFQCSTRTISRAIAHLKKIGYIEEIKWWDMGTYRKLRIKNNIDNKLDYVWDTQKEDEELKQLTEQELERRMLLHPKYYKNVRI